jgi:hypothetical protein
MRIVFPTPSIARDFTGSPSPFKTTKKDPAERFHRHRVPSAYPPARVWLSGERTSDVILDGYPPNDWISCPFSPFTILSVPVGIPIMTVSPQHVIPKHSRLPFSA